MRKLSKEIFKNAGVTFLEICQLTFMSQEDMAGIVQIKGEEHLLEASKGNKGMILITAHLGNWEIGYQVMCYAVGRPATAVARKIRFVWVDRWLHHLRTRFGNTVIYKRGAFPKMVETLRQGGILGLLVDQSKRKHGVDVRFFGHEATATPAVALLALRCKSPILPGFCVREANGRFALHVGAPLELIRTKDLRSDLQANTQIMMSAVEDMIREYPEQWLWFQRPWKKAHPELYPEWEAKRQRRKERKRQRRKERKRKEAA
jgi:KDO2-lipid IV(A) lauroyltransferase